MHNFRRMNILPVPGLNEDTVVLGGSVSITLIGGPSNENLLFSRFTMPGKHGALEHVLGRWDPEEFKAVVFPVAVAVQLVAQNLGGTGQQ